MWRVWTHSGLVSIYIHHTSPYSDDLLLLVCCAGSDDGPLSLCRLYFTMRRLNSISPTVRKYCKQVHLGLSVLCNTIHMCALSRISKDNSRLLMPSLSELKSHRIVVSTLSTARALTLMEMPKGHFTHIFIDEAAQVCGIGPGGMWNRPGWHLEQARVACGTGPGGMWNRWYVLREGVGWRGTEVGGGRWGRGGQKWVEGGGEEGDRSGWREVGKRD